MLPPLLIIFRQRRVRGEGVDILAIQASLLLQRKSNPSSELFAAATTSENEPRGLR
jgi:hypothetical protein